MVLFIPGYALIAAFFPARGDLDGIERVALSFGLSIAVTPLIGLRSTTRPGGIRLDPILVSLTLFSLAMAAVAWYRRLLLPADERFSVPAREMLASARNELFDPEGTPARPGTLSSSRGLDRRGGRHNRPTSSRCQKRGEHFHRVLHPRAGREGRRLPDRFWGREKPDPDRRGREPRGTGRLTTRSRPLLLNQTFEARTNTSTIHAAQAPGPIHPHGAP